jgi:localization factor PodJL
MWFAIAADQGDADAGKKRDEVGAKLDSKELAAAKELVGKFKPAQPARAANDVPPPRGGWENVKGPGGKPLMKPLGRPKISRL